MKKIINIFLVTGISLAIMMSCVEEQEDFRYDGPSLAEFKNYYLEQQTRLGAALFQSVNYNIVTGENIALNRLTVRQPAALLTGVVTAAAGSTALTGQAAIPFTGVISGNTLTVSGIAGTPIAIGLEITGAGVATNTKITRFLSGTGGNGTYVVNNSQTVASVAMSTVSTRFLTELQVGSIVKSAAGTVIGSVASITSDNAATLAANVPTLSAVTRSAYRGSVIPSGGLVFSDSILVQLVGRQLASDITVTYIKDPENPAAPAGVAEAVEGVHYNFVRNNAGELVINGNSSSGYIYINVLDGLGAADPDRVTLLVTLTDDGDLKPSENYKTFTYNIIK